MRRMSEMASTKRHQKATVKELQSLGAVNVFHALDKVKQHAWAKFDESVDVSVRLGVDPRKPNQAIKGVAKLPYGTGKKTSVAVFATGDDVEVAKEAGADFVGLEELIEMVQEGNIPFTRAIATPDVMPKLSILGKILGPRGLMPNPKLGTLTTNITKAVKDAKGGAVQFKVQKQGVINTPIGKLSFDNEALLENIRATMTAITDLKPEGFKGKYLMGVSISSTMGPGIELERASIDPSSPRFMLDPDAL